MALKARPLLMGSPPLKLSKTASLLLDASLCHKFHHFGKIFGDSTTLLKAKNPRRISGFLTIKHHLIRLVFLESAVLTLT